MTHNGTLPLSMILPGQRARLVRIDAGCRVVHRLTEMGLTPGVELEVVQQGRGCPLLVAVRDTRLALGRGMAEKVMVKVVDEHG